MDSTLFYIIFISLALFYIYIGYRASLSVHSMEDYFLAGRTLTPFQLTISLIATQLGGGFILGTSKEAYLFGIYGLLYVAGVCLGLILLASGFASRMRSLNVVTTAQLFSVYYKSPFLHKVASICSIVSLIGIFAAQIIGSKALMISLNVYNPHFFILLWICIIGYAALGGLRAIVQNDIFQVSWIIIIFIGLFLWALMTYGIEPFVVARTRTDIFKLTEQYDWSRFLLIPLMPMLYSLIEQDLAQVFFAARSSLTALVSAWCAALFMVLFALIPLYFGVQARLMGISIDQGANPLISFVDQTFNQGIVALVAYGVFAAIISTANGLLCAISSNVVQDFGLGTGTQRSQIYTSKLVMCLIGLIGLWLGLIYTDLIEMLVDSYAVPVSALFVSLFMVYIHRGQGALSRWAAYVSVLSGLSAFLYLVYIQSLWMFSAQIDALVLSVIGYIIGYCAERIATTFKWI